MIFLIWSQKQRAWWRPEAMGYTKSKAEAGRYTVESLKQCHLDGVEGDRPRSADLLLPEAL